MFILQQDRGRFRAQENFISTCAVFLTNVG